MKIAFLDTVISDIAERRLFAIEDGGEWRGQVVGVVHLCLVPKGGSSVRHLYVAPAKRRQGIATELMNQCLAFAQMSGSESLGLELSVTDRILALPFYRKMGFSIVGSYPDGDCRMARILTVITPEHNPQPVGKYGNCVDCRAPFMHPSAMCPWHSEDGIEDVCCTCNNKRLAAGTQGFADEAMITKCLHVLCDEKKVSVAAVQRGLQIGYTNADQLIRVLTVRGYTDQKRGWRWDQSLLAVRENLIVAGGFTPVEADNLITKSKNIQNLVGKKAPCRQ